LTGLRVSQLVQIEGPVWQRTGLFYWLRHSGMLFDKKDVVFLQHEFYAKANAGIIATMTRRPLVGT
jgi:hypothetical protein